ASAIITEAAKATPRFRITTLLCSKTAGVFPETSQRETTENLAGSLEPVAVIGGKAVLGSSGSSPFLPAAPSSRARRSVRRQRTQIGTRAPADVDEVCAALRSPP